MGLWEEILYKLILIYLLILLAHAQLLENCTNSTLPTDDSFYTPPPGYEDARPGTILRHRETPSPIAAFGLLPINISAAYHILYRSSDSFGNATATVATVLIPHNADLTKIVSYQVAEDAASPNCAPSYVLQCGSDRGGLMGSLITQAELLLMIAAMENGWVVTVPDHEGPNAAYLANIRAGYAVLDGIRATLASSKFTGIPSEATVTIWGYSGGSLASGFAAELHPSYAPDLDIAGAAIGGTVPDIKYALLATNDGPRAGLIAAGILGLANEYTELQAVIEEQLVEKTHDEFMNVTNLCYTAVEGMFSGVDIGPYFRDPEFLTNNPVVDALMANIAMGQHVPTMPIFLYKAANDEISPENYTTELVRGYCAGGAAVDYRMAETGGHTPLAVTGAPGAMIWLRDRMKGVPPKERCETSKSLIGLEDLEALEVLSETLIKILLDLLGKPID